MDDTQNQNPPVQNMPVQQGSVQPSQAQQPVQPVQPLDSAQRQQPVAGGPKEKVAMPASSKQEWVAPSTPEVQIPKELEGHVEATSLPTIPQDVQNAGVIPAKEATPVLSVTDKDEPLGLGTSPSVLVAIKKAHSSVKDSIRWLAELVGLAQQKRDREIEKGGQQ